MALYDNFAHTFSKSRQDHPWPELEYIIRDLRDHGYTSVLDVGCGNGRCIEEFEKMDTRPERYLGIDNSTSMIDEARRLHPNYRFEVYDMLALSTLEAGVSYEAIILLASFHHLTIRAERIQVLSDLKKLLTPGGRIYMTNWNLRDQLKYEKSHRGNGDYDIKIGAYSRYYHGFSVEELGELFRETGYAVVENRVWEGVRNIVSVLSF